MKRKRNFLTIASVRRMRRKLHDVYDMLGDPSFVHHMLLRRYLGSAAVPEVMSRQELDELNMGMAEFLSEMSSLITPVVCRSCQASGDKARGICWLQEIELEPGEGCGSSPN